MEKIVGGLKAQGPGKALVWLLAAAALSVPDFSRATAYVVSLPDAAYPFPVLLGALAALYAMFANRLPRCRGALAAALLVACLAFELACAFMQRTLADWNYLSVNAGFTAIGRALRLLALCALLSWSGGGEGLSDGARRRAAACLGASGALCALALRCLEELGCAREETLAASVAGWAYLAVPSALSTARGFAVGMPLANGVFAFLVGAFIGTDAATVACGSATAAAEASWALAGVLRARRGLPRSPRIAPGAGRAGGVGVRRGARRRRGRGRAHGLAPRRHPGCGRALVSRGPGRGGGARGRKRRGHSRRAWGQAPDRLDVPLEGVPEAGRLFSGGAPGCCEVVRRDAGAGDAGGPDRGRRRCRSRGAPSPFVRPSGPRLCCCSPCSCARRFRCRRSGSPFSPCPCC